MAGFRNPERENIALSIPPAPVSGQWEHLEQEVKVLTESMLMADERGEQPIFKMEMLRAEPGAEVGFI